MSGLDRIFPMHGEPELSDDFTGIIIDLATAPPMVDYGDIAADPEFVRWEGDDS